MLNSGGGDGNTGHNGSGVSGGGSGGGSRTGCSAANGKEHGGKTGDGCGGTAGGDNDTVAQMTKSSSACMLSCGLARPLDRNDSRLAADAAAVGRRLTPCATLRKARAHSVTTEAREGGTDLTII